MSAALDTAGGRAGESGAGGQGRAGELATSGRIAWRELRSGLQGFRIFLACLILGVAALAGVRSVSSALDAGLAEEGRVILGGDIEFSLIHRRADDRQIAYFEKAGDLSEIATLRAMARPDAADNGARALVEVKAVDGDYPLFGAMALAGGGTLRDALARRDGHWGLVADPLLLARLGIAPGALVHIGDAVFELRDEIVTEPDRASDGLMFGPRVMMMGEALREAGLVQPGSLINWEYRLRVPEPADIGALTRVSEGAKAAFPDAGWRITARTNAAPGVKRFVDRLTLFLSLVGLTALFVGGIGIANAVTNFLDGKRRNIATFKCLGASGRTVFQIYLIQVLALAGLGIAAGVVLGAAVPVVAGLALRGLLPLPLEIGLYPEPLAVAAAFGLLITLAFAIWPLARARSLPAQALFRDTVAPQQAWPGAAYVAATAAALAGLAGLAFWAFEDRWLTAWYMAGLSGSFLVLLGLGRGLMRLAARARRPRGPSVRLAIANLHRPGAPTTSVVLSLGLGLSLFVTLALVDTNLTRELRTSLPEQAPSFFFLDIQPGQRDAFVERLSASDGAHDIEQVPMLRGRITRVNGVPAREVTPSEEAAWALRGDRGLTYSSDVPENSTLVAGEWWPDGYDGEPLVSMAAEIAQGLGLTIGDTVSVNVLGREITAEIASLREVDWRSLSINFVMVFSPSALEAAPHTFLVTAKTPPEREGALLKDMTDAFPNVTAVRVKEALETVNDLMSKLLMAVRGANAMTLMIGVLVLAGALATGLRARIYDAVVLKTFGATRRQLIGAYVVEYGLLGLATALFAVLAGTAASYAVMTFAIGSGWVFSAPVAVSTALLATAITVTAGLATTWVALRAKPAPFLRNE